MKKLILLAIIALSLVACTPREKKNDAPPTPKTPDTASAPQQPESAKQIVNNYEKTLVTSIDRAKGAQAQVDLGAIQDAIRNFQMENGRYPNSLDAIKSYLRPGTDLSAFNYDAGTGAVTVK